MNAERTMPHSLDAEKSTLGAILVDGTRLLDVAEIVVPQDFYRQAHGRIYAGLLALAEGKTEIDFITVKDWLERRGELEEVGGPAYLSSLTDGVPRGSNAVHYAGIVKQHAKRRALIQSATSILASAYDTEKPADEVCEDAERLIYGLKTGTDQRGGLVPMAQIAAAGLAELETIIQRKGQLTGVPSGFVDLDELTNGFQPGTLTIVAARPSMGKSALAFNIAAHVGGVGRPVGIFSLEMSHSEIFMRLVSAEAHVDGRRLKRGDIYGSEWSRISHAYEALSTWPVHVDESPYVGTFDMRGRARRMKLQYGLDLIIVDYLQLMQAAKGENRNLEIAAISRALKGLAKELQIPVIALSQLSRDLERRDDKRPKLSDLRDSGALEQDADVVIFLYREAVYNDTDENQTKAEAIIGKQRNGPIGVVELNWIKEETRFENYSNRAVPVDVRGGDR